MDVSGSWEKGILDRELGDEDEDDEVKKKARQRSASTS